MRNCRNKITDALVALCVMICAACTNEWDEEQTGMILRENEVALQWLPANMAIQHVKTRVSDPKTAEEQQINNVHVFIFGSDGDYLKPEESDAIQGYRYLSDVDNVVLNTDLFGNQEAAKNATIVVLANIPEDTFHDTDGNSYPDEITNLESFNSFTFNLPTWTATLPETGLPMYGKVEHDLSSTSANKIVMVQLQSMMARIDLDFTLDPYPETGNSQYPSLRFDEVTVKNFPKGGTIVPQLDLKKVTADVDLLKEETTVTELDNFTGHILRDNGETLTLTLYLFEHAREAKAFDYPTGIGNDEKQRYKNKLAAEDAAYITLTGVYTNYNGYMYKITYTIYPGANAVNDFTIKANHQYKHNITVRGITVNSLGEEALLDTRVDIDTEANPYFIEMLREREHDAHFCVTPMDVFIYENGGSVRVEIVNPESTPWIRMEPMRYAPEDCNPDRKWAADEAGEGKRKYFLTNLVQSDGSSPAVLQGQDYYTDYTVVYNNEKANDKGVYEERIYFYIDENVPTASQSARGEDVEEREAQIRITYKQYPNETSPWDHERLVTIRQAGMRAVQFPGQQQINANDNTSWGYVGYTFYIETYEEYLEHYDGKDQYDHSYPGLEWGFMNIMTSLGTRNGNYYMPYGWRNTMTIMDKFRDEVRSGRFDGPYDITLNDKPRGASEYCYNKNKRNEQGKVEICHWFHPTIRELERAIDDNYGRFEEFQNNWYWSSNPGPWGENGGLTGGNLTWTGEHSEYARATKANRGDYNPSTGNYEFNHATSEADKPYERINGNWDTPYTGQMGVSAEHEGGYARRNKIFRIRAAYIVETPDGQYNYDSNPPTISNANNIRDYANN